MEYSILLSRLKTASESFLNLETQLADPDISNNPKKLESIARERSKLEPLVNDYDQLQKLDTEIDETKRLLKDSKDDKEMEGFINDELLDLQNNKDNLIQRIKIALLPKDPRDDRSVMLEIRAGAGGNEACIWAGDLARMYERYGQKVGWSVKPISASESDLGGFKELVISVKGESVYSQLKFEAGVHRVQRVPATESQGRVHTSIATVAVLPEAEDVDINIDQNDLKVDVYRSSGPGGQSVNTTDSAVRITHIPTGLVVSCQDEKSQLQNKEKAMRILRARLLKAEQEKAAAERAKDRKEQVGSGERSDKIRTYNYKDNRVSDHRINLTLKKLDQVLDGDLDEFVDALVSDNEASRLANLDE